jgi:hypothetical protein
VRCGGQCDGMIRELPLHSSGRLSLAPMDVRAYASVNEAKEGCTLICPCCQHISCRRSHRRGFRDYAVGITGLRPWRCRECNARFFAWAVPFPYQKYAHCSQCGNLEVNRISGDLADGRLRFLWKRLHIPAYRCAPCRKKFFTIRHRMPRETVNVTSAAS